MATPLMDTSVKSMVDKIEVVSEEELYELLLEDK